MILVDSPIPLQAIVTVLESHTADYSTCLLVFTAGIMTRSGYIDMDDILTQSRR